MGVNGYLLALEGGGTRSQAALFDPLGRVLHTGESTDVNTNFVPLVKAKKAVTSAVKEVLRTTGVGGKEVSHFVLALVGPKFGVEIFGKLCPNAIYHYYVEKDVIFARAGVYQPHGVAVVAATGTTAWAVRADDGRQTAFGGWGSLLGDEGSAYALGLLGLRNAVRVYEGRLKAHTQLVDAVCEHFGLPQTNFHRGLIYLAYQKPLNRAEIAGFAVAITRLAYKGDPVALSITRKVAEDLANVAMHAARSLFTPDEAFVMAIAGGLTEAGELILSPLRLALQQEFSQTVLMVGTEQPAVALGKLALNNLQQEVAC